MGTYFGYRSVAEIRREMAEAWTNDQGERCQIVDIVQRGSNLWGIFTRGGQPEAIMLYKTSRERGDYGYKPMDDSVGPYYWNVPLAYLERIPAVNPEWAEDVRAYHRGEDVRARVNARWEARRNVLTT